MSEMFVSSLWKGDFNKLSLLCVLLKRVLIKLCTLPLCLDTEVKPRIYRWSDMHILCLILFPQRTLAVNIFDPER